MKVGISILLFSWSLALVSQTVSQNFQMANAQNSGKVGFFSTLPTAAPGVKKAYYLNEKWKYASINFKQDQQETYRILTKVNVYDEELEVNHDDDVKVIPLSDLHPFILHEEHRDRRLFGSGTGGFKDPGVYEVLFSNKDQSSRILKRYYCKLYPVTYIAAFDVGESDEVIKIEEELIVILDHTIKTMPGNKRGFYQLFANPDRVKSYAKKHKLSMKEESDLVDLFKWGISQE